MKAVRTLSVTVLVLLSSLTVDTVRSETINGIEILRGTWNGEQVEYLDGEILIGLKPGKSQRDATDDLGAIAVEIVRPADATGLLKVRTVSRTGFFEIIDSISMLPSVRYAEPNMVDRMHVIPNDSLFTRQWHYHNTGQVPPGGSPDADIDAPEGWDISTGSASIKVGILDSGIPIKNGSLSHPDLDDPNRFFLGLDLVNNDFKPTDDNGHGTHVTGTVAAETNNVTGVAGVCWNAQVLAIKVFDYRGVSTHEIFRDACIYAVDNGCQVINYSGGGSPSSTKEHGVAYADSHDVVICTSAGNNDQGAVGWPGAYSTLYSNVICVSATDHNDQSSPYSSIGPEVTVSAPGGFGEAIDDNDVISTMPDYFVRLNQQGVPQDYGPLAGTSMASPHVAGLAALILSYKPTLIPDSVREIIKNTADDLGPPGFDDQFGWGRINAYKALFEMGVLTITHTPLSDTKDTVDEYEVVCTITSVFPLVSDSLLLHYEISSVWSVDVLTPTGGADEYQSSIPPQLPGTEISYYISARDSADAVVSTPVYTFRVIDYAFSVSPTSQGMSGLALDTVWHPLWIANLGHYVDRYSLSDSGWNWPTAIFDSTGSVMVTETPDVQPGESVVLLVRVEVPTSNHGDSDRAVIMITSVNEPLLISSAIVRTFSAGSPLSPPLIDIFPSTVIDPAKWQYNFNCEIDEWGYNEPSPPYCLNLDAHPEGADTLVSWPFDLRSSRPVVVSYYFEKQGYMVNNFPESNDYLQVDYLNHEYNWVTIATHFGGPPYEIKFEKVEVFLPQDANHAGFQLRFTSRGKVPPYPDDWDDWLVDDVSLDLQHDYDLWLLPEKEQHIANQDDTFTTPLAIHNRGLFSDYYTLSTSGATWDITFWDTTDTAQITSTGIIDPLDSVVVLMKIVVPASAPLWTKHEALAIASSANDSLALDTTKVVTISAGPPMDFPWSESFPEYPLDSTRWLVNDGGWVTSVAENPPSPPYTLNLMGGDTVISRLIDLSGQNEALLTYYFQRGGIRDAPEPGDDLVFEYLDSSGNWALLDRQYGSGPVMSTFEAAAAPLPDDAMHDAFQLQIYNLGSYANDDWFMDDIAITYAPAITVSPASIVDTILWGDSTETGLFISNAGPGTLAYDVSVIPVFDASTAFGRLLSQGRVNPARYEFPADLFRSELPKGFPDNRHGVQIPYGAGGPDNFGYIWLDSDEQGGPNFSWIDITTTGTEITGLGDDNFAGSFAIGFDFEFYGQVYQEFYVGSNGLIGFSPAIDLDELNNTALPYPAQPNNLLAWCWKDLNILDPSNPGGKVYYESNGERLVIQFVNYPEYNAAAGDVINAEVILQSDRTIVFQYSSIGQGFDRSGCTVGIENKNGTDGLTVVFNAQYLRDSLAVQFSLPAGWITVEPMAGEVLPDSTDTLTARMPTIPLVVGTYEATIRITSNEPNPALNPWIVPVELVIEWGPLVCGDVDLDDKVNVSDLSYLVTYLFHSGPAPPRPESADVDGSGSINVADIIYLVYYLFFGGPEPTCE